MTQGVASSQVAGLLKGKRGLIVGVANDHSLAWGVAELAHQSGAELAFTYQGEAFGKRVKPLVASLGNSLCLPADVEDEASLEAVFKQLAQQWDRLDFVVHAVAWSDKDELSGRYLNTTRANFSRSLEISCYSFTHLARLAEPMMTAGGSLLTLTYEGASRVMPSYNVMGVAKAALESSVRYLAHDLGGQGIRVNALSSGPMRTLAGSAVGSARKSYAWQGQSSPLGRNLELREVGGTALYLISDLSAGVTGEVMFVDGGYHLVGMAIPNKASHT